MLNRINAYIEEQHLLYNPLQRVLLAVSGGRDSVCMAHLMHAAGYRISIAHCNFHLRPGDCDRDQEFVRQLAKELNVDFYTTDFDTRAIAREYGMSIEEAARELRYEWFGTVCRQHDISVVATAHHRDDSIETFFLNLFRGTGIAGLHGIRPEVMHRAVRIIHPMLCFSRSDIDRYVDEHHLAYVEDSTNADLDARRNRIRHQLMPLLRELYPSVDTTMEANIKRLADVEEVYRASVEDMADRLEEWVYSPFGFRYTVFKLSDLADLKPQTTLLYELLQPYGFGAAVVSDIVAALPAARTGSTFLSPWCEAVIDRGRLLVADREESEPLQVDSEAIVREEVPYLGFGRECSTIEYVDADLVRQPFTLRPWQAGDRMQPLGMEHQRLVSDVMKDAKLNLLEKRRVHVLVDADGRIVWLVGVRIDHRFRVTDSTLHALRLKIKA
ncbi:MAG: tRNA lysidine(34) synthetase TilS [Bacteroidales bacterium]|nr:tRNA lysidine(34) synthetase TilS [Bacteroidales bacterium]